MLRVWGLKLQVDEALSSDSFRKVAGNANVRGLCSKSIGFLALLIEICDQSGQLFESDKTPILCINMCGSFTKKTFNPRSI